VRFEDVVFALDAFQKKSRKGIATSKADLDRIKARLKRAEEIYAEGLKEREDNGKDKD
jgi:phage-related protein